MLGIIQEQNPDRCRLFMQWKKMDWPVMVDSFDLLEVGVVPLTYAIDEHGIVRFAGLRRDAMGTLKADFIDRAYTDSRQKPDHPVPQAEEALAPAALGDRALIERAIVAYSRRAETSPSDGWAHFRLAVSYRLRYDSDPRHPDDFQRAIDHWQRALDLDPNNYIWRRRIQQYGPRLDKPYPFYDWIEPARQEIRASGNKPVALIASPTGSEIASPKSDAPGHREIHPASSPDPKNRVFKDASKPANRFILVEQTAVPRRLSPGQSSRIHLVFRPNPAKRAHWNNESEPLRIWLKPPADWKTDGRLLIHDSPTSTATSDEIRRLEVELDVPTSAKPGNHHVEAYALYYVCEDAKGTCLYRRQDFEIPIELRSP